MSAPATSGPPPSPTDPSLDDFFSVTYEELRRLAAAVRKNDPSATMNPTALVHEAWIKLSASRSYSITSALHFKRLAARAMRQLLIEAARRRKAQKRGGLHPPAVSLLTAPEAALGFEVSQTEDVLALDDALNDLERLSPLQAQIVELRFFAGLSVAAIAEVLELSPDKINYEWRIAKSWLSRKLRAARRTDPDEH